MLSVDTKKKELVGPFKTGGGRGGPRESPTASTSTISRPRRRAKSGLRVKAVLDMNEYETGVKVTKSQMEELRIRQHRTHPDWNYTLEPHP